MLLMLLSLSAHAENFGIGIALGNPSGITFKIMTGSKAGIDLLVGEMSERWGYDDWGYDEFVVSADYVVTLGRLTSGGTASLDFYLGGGANIWLGRWDGNALAAEMPIGLSLMFNSAPVEIFFEADPMLFILPFGYFDIGGSIGARYYF